MLIVGAIRLSEATRSHYDSDSLKCVMKKWSRSGPDELAKWRHLRRGIPIWKTVTRWFLSFFLYVWMGEWMVFTIFKTAERFVFTFGKIWLARSIAESQVVQDLTFKSILCMLLPCNLVDIEAWNDAYDRQVRIRQQKDLHVNFDDTNYVLVKGFEKVALSVCKVKHCDILTLWHFAT